MNKRYIDFVPTKTGANRAAGSARPAHVARQTRPAGSSVTGSSAAPVTRPVAPVRQAKPVRPVAPAARPAVPVRAARSVNAAKPVTSVRPAEALVRAGAVPALGVVEDLSSKFVKTDVPKRPLSQAPEPSQATLAAAKAKKVKSRHLLRSAPGKHVEKPVENSGTAGVNQAPDKTAFKTPQSPFISNAKVEKRPLSGNVYPRKMVNTPVSTKVGDKAKVGTKGPVAIIAKPEKESHVGIVVTIIITIILGAAAGTAAFLLLPK